MRIFVSGDVMTGRGIDQILAHPGAPDLYETWAKSAIRYVELAERKNGAIPSGVDSTYVWGDALSLLDSANPEVRIINLETTVTDRGDPWPGKGIHYRMHPDNVDVLTAAGIDCCVLANNHTLDWSHPGLEQTLATLHGAGMATAGAGADATEAQRPALIDTGGGSRVAVTALGTRSSGIPRSWAAGVDQPGVSLVHSLSQEVMRAVEAGLASVTGPEDVSVVSIHWGPNWGFDIDQRHRRFAHGLIDETGVDIVHGHSSHHPLGIEVYQNRLILYGCGDLINDYEGIGGHDEYRPGLGLLYLIDTDPGVLRGLEMIPVRLRRFRLEAAPHPDVVWLAETLTTVSEEMGTRVEESGPGRLRAVW